jgi:hypothetical protein
LTKPAAYFAQQLNAAAVVWRWLGTYIFEDVGGASGGLDKRLVIPKSQPLRVLK